MLNKDKWKNFLKRKQVRAATDKGMKTDKKNERVILDSASSIELTIKVRDEIKNNSIN